MATDDLEARFAEIGGDYAFSVDLLERLNAGTLGQSAAQVAEFPLADGRQILDLRGEGPWELPRAEARQRLARLLPGFDPGRWIPEAPEPTVALGPEVLDDLGLALVPWTAFGILNGGMATSYADTKKNQALGSGLFQVYRPDFERLAPQVAGLPKGITPAFVQPDGTPGPSFLELKVRALEVLNLAAAERGYSGPGLRWFQMTSQSTDGPLAEAIAALASSPGVAPLAQPGREPWVGVPTAVQDLVATFTQARDGLPRRFFTVKRQGRELPYALPGGHGQNFRVLAPVYRDLLAQGYRWAYLGNVDNLGFLPSPRGLALLALSGAPAAFDFSFKTPVDVKGGLLYREASGRLNCADLGVALDPAQAAAAEKAGRPLLFNCATGLFDLERLVADLDRITRCLPVRLSDQDKDIGRYTQAEQVTWEVIGLLEDPLIFGVEKNRRFLAAKLLLDGFLTSGLRLDDPRFDQADLIAYRSLAAGLNAGLQALLEGPLGYRLEGQRWEPRGRDELVRRWRLAGANPLAN